MGSEGWRAAPEPPGAAVPAAAAPGAQPGQRWDALVCRPRPSAGLIYSRVCPSLMFAQREEQERGRASRVPQHRAGPAPAARLGLACLLVRAFSRLFVCLF